MGSLPIAAWALFASATSARPRSVLGWVGRCLVPCVLLAPGTGCVSFSMQETEALAPSPGVVVRTEQLRYAVHGRTARQLVTGMLTLGPRDETGRHHAYTRFRLAWNHNPQPTATACRPGQPEVTLLTLTVLPQWQDLAQGAAPLQARWQQFLAATEQHELGHVHLCIRAANSLSAQLAGLPPRPDCAALQADAERLAATILRALGQKHAEYDRQTEHGVRQGGHLTTDLLADSY